MKNPTNKTLEKLLWQQIERYAPTGALYVSGKTMVASLLESVKDQGLLRLRVTEYRVQKFIRKFVHEGRLLFISDYTRGVHGRAYLLMDKKFSGRSVKARIICLRRELLRLVEKHRASESKINKQDDPRYGRAHRATRCAYKAKLIAHGQLPCYRCGEPVFWNKRFHLDHLDGSDTLYGGVSHPLCNIKHQIHNRATGWISRFSTSSLPTWADSH